ncbi:uncharacterized protein K444DRAFT_643632 [Hyaloscypha bicolor E]|uniref:Protein kinase domain-containing protein n=1 Tax=Hyaloscypha bicolor E TaxID=1095630 RepID=A0A2J6T735_9HELO|nr:uncharacterized protein K444DRAFT_643632 [Hyaloscypha bicolor E]PMD58841.1 hypothetical protein K444DRAFT_643632 [Hyaloscypha bicolor E]
MDIIEGVKLEETWPKLSWFTTIRLAFQLRGFIHQLRSVTSQYAGSLVSGQCKSAPSTITSFLRFWINFVSIRKAKANASSPPLPSTAWIPPTAETLVLTHHDLAPRDILLNRHNQIRLIDGDFARFYPKYFKHASIYEFNIPESWNWFAWLRWRAFSFIQTKFTRWRVGQRFEIMQNGVKSEPSVD